MRVEEALTAEQIARFNRTVDNHLQTFPGDWISLSDSFTEAVDILPHTAAFDESIENPKTLEILCAILGERIAFEEFAILLRNPTGNLKEVKGWHRDLIRDYSRRDGGKSTGDFNAQSFHDRAGEALAALHYLHERPEVRADAVGLWGHSQGGMVVPLAASLSDQVSFVIQVSGWQGATHPNA